MTQFSNVLIMPLIAASILLASCSQNSKNVKAGSDNYGGHGLTSVSSEVLQKFAPPKLDPAMSQKIQSMMDVRATGAGISSPDGKHLYFGWSVTGVSQVWRVDGPKTFPVQMTGGEDKTTLAAVSYDGKKIILERDRNGEENPGIYWQSATGGALHEIQHKAGVQSKYSGMTKDSKFIYFRSNDIKSDSYAIYRYELATRKKELLYAGEGNWFVDDISPDHKKLLLGRSITNLHSEHFEFDLKSHQLTPVIGQGEQQEYEIIYAKQAGEFLVSTPKIGEFRQLYRLSDKKLIPITQKIQHDVAGFSIDSDLKRIYYTVNEDGYSRTHVLDASSFQEIALPSNSLMKTAEHVVASSGGPSSRFVSLAVSTHNAPRTSYVIDWNTREAKQWLIPASPEVDTSHAAKATLEYYPTRDGVKIPMFVRRPDHCENGCPVIVHFHGGPEGQSTPGFWTSAQMIVDAGFIFVEPNVRGSDGYGKSWIDSDNQSKRLNVITDIEDCSKFIKEKWATNGVAPKVGIMGWSYGGYSTLIAMTMFAGSYDAGVAMVGMSNLLTFLNNTAPYRRALRTPEYGDPVADHDALVKLSPTTYLDRLKSPLLIIQGANDPRVPVNEAIQIHELLEKKNIPSELIIFADEGHGAQKRGNRVLEFGSLLTFFQKHLK